MKHADLIRAVLDGKKIQVRYRSNVGKWSTFSNPNDAITALANEAGHYEFREEPPPEVVKYRWVPSARDLCGYRYWLDAVNLKKPYEKITWDGATGEVKSIELIKE